VDDTVVVGISHSRQTDAEPTDPDDYTHRVVGLDRETGSERWTSEFDDLVWAGPTRVGDGDAATGDVLVTTEAGDVARLDAGTGEVRWRTSLDAAVERPALVADGRVLAATVEGTVRELDPTTGDRGWLGTLPGTPTGWTQTAGVVVVADDTGRVTALRPTQDGEQRWQYEADAGVGGLDTRDGIVYALDQRGVVHAINATDGERFSRQRYAENRDDGCGWSGQVPRTYGLAASTEALFLAGRWLGAVARDE
jgi:outer membrane protein assembly factor BamB